MSLRSDLYRSSPLWISVAAFGCHQNEAPRDDRGARAEPAAPAVADPNPGHRTGNGAPPSSSLPSDGKGYDMELRIDPPPSAGVASRLVFDPRAPSGERVPKLAIVHEKPLHMLLVSRDLSFFAHEHPEPQPDGTLGIDLVLPPAGEYIAFADFTPEGATQQIARKSVTVAGESAPARPLVVDDRAKAKAFGDFRVSLGPQRITAGGRGVMLEFVLQRGDAPVAGLRPYLGAMGHCVIISEDTTQFLHSHPSKADEAKPHVVTFHAVFPETGKYKLWGQFDVAGEMLISDFVVEVEDGTAADETPADPHANHPH